MPGTIVDSMFGPLLTGILGLANVPNTEAVALSPAMGWWMLACAGILIAIFIVHRETWRRLFLRAEDPRSMGLFRIVFGLCTLANINGLSEIFIYLFTDEGLFTTDVARQVFANQQFAGFGDGFAQHEPWGFFDVQAWIQWFKGPKFSLLFFWDSPAVFWGHLVAFEVACVCLIVGFQTRYTKWLALLLFHSLSLRNQIYWEGTENVFRTFLFYLCLSRCGAAYSLDNWLRCRKLKKQGLLSEHGGPGEGAGAPPSQQHPQGLEAIYRLIPAWPRMLMILQLGALYCTTGVVKNGSVWAKGNAFYYALNLDHFYRFEPQQLSAVLGTNLFRLNTWVVHWWECFFPLVIAGLVIRFHIREQIPRLRGGMLWLSRGLWVCFGLAVLFLVRTALPVHPAQGMSTEQLTNVFTLAWLGGMVTLGLLFHVLRHNPPTVTLRGRRFTLDLTWFCTWFLGRRLWLGLGIIFHAHLIMLMNIGWFTPGVLCVYIVCLNGHEIAALLHRLGSRVAPLLGKLGLSGPASWRAANPLPGEDLRLPHHIRDRAELPGFVLVAGLAVAVFGVYLALPVQIVEDGERTTVAGMNFMRTGGYLFCGLAAAAIWWTRENGSKTHPVVEPHSGLVRRPWAYGPMGRFVANTLVVYHITGVATWLLPDKECLSTWRTQAREPFIWWLKTTHTTQSWRMFAPNPPRSNRFMRVLVTDQQGEVTDLNTDVYHPQNRPLPWIWYTRQRKINRRLTSVKNGKPSWYLKWHARYICREWARTHGGEAPKKVQVVKQWYRILTPEEVKKNGPYDPVEQFKRRHGEKYVYTARCATEIGAQLSNEIRERYGLPLVPEKSVKRWHKQHRIKWNQRREQLQARGRDPDSIPLLPISIVVFAGMVLWRWREMDLDFAYEARKASAAGTNANPQMTAAGPENAPEDASVPEAGKPSAPENRTSTKE